MWLTPFFASNMSKMIYRMFLSIFMLHFSHVAKGQPAEFWNKQAQDTLNNALKLQHLNLNIAKNVILFLGDGLDISTMTAARIRKGQLLGHTGEEASLVWDQFDHVALSKTYNTDLQVGDSAGTATAFLCGVKAKAGTLGVDDRAFKGNCSSAAGAEVDSVLALAQQAGKSTGFVTTARVTHATPGALYAHTPHRGWECDYHIPDTEKAAGCKDIAVQLIENGKDINVIMGGGRAYFMTNNTRDPEDEERFGKRSDDRDLINEWISMRPHKDGSKYVYDQSGFDKIDVKETDYLLGLFERSHMQYENRRATEDKGGEPSISEMTEKAIQILQKNKNGFFLMVEGGRIDHGHHKGVAHYALTDTLAFDHAVETALKMTKEADTLIIVTADHGHVMSIAGYPGRGNPILGLNTDDYGLDGLPYTTLLYANGPGGIELHQSYYRNGTRRNLTLEATDDVDFIQTAAVPLNSETHGGQDVGIYARGPMAHLFHGVHEQNYIAHVMKYASCLGEYQELCHSEVHYQAQVLCGRSSTFKHEPLITLVLLVVIMFYHTLQQ